MKPSNSTAFPYLNYSSAFLYFVFVMLLGVSAAKQGLSNFYSDKALSTGSITLADSAISFEPGNPNAHKSRGMILLTNKEHAAAAGAFEKAISWSNNDFLLWLHLGYCQFQQKNFDSAKFAYERALVLAPSYSQPQYYMGTMLLESGHSEQAFRFLSKAAEQNTELYPEILHLARITFPDDPQAIEKSVWPTSIEAKKLVTRYLIEHSFITDGVRSFIMSNELSDSERNEFVRDLIIKQEFQIAREIWLSKEMADVDSVNELIFDGGFEKIIESDKSGFGWQIDQEASAISVALDDKTFHFGARAIRIKFAGNVEMNRRLISQLTYIKPRHRYQLKFFLNSPEMISAGLPAIVINDGVSDKLLGRSNDIQSTQGQWVETKINFTAGATPAATISLQRPFCNTSPCPLFGELILDDFSLTEVPAP